MVNYLSHICHLLQNEHSPFLTGQVVTVEGSEVQGSGIFESVITNIQ